MLSERSEFIERFEGFVFRPPSSGPFSRIYSGKSEYIRREDGEILTTLMFPKIDDNQLFSREYMLNNANITLFHCNFNKNQLLYS